MNDMPAWLVIDSGGTKTHLLLTDPLGHCLRELYCKGVGTAVDSDEEMTDEFIDAVKEIANEYRVRRIAANLGGRNEHQLYSQLNRIFPSADIHVFRESSGVVARQLAQKYHADAVLFQRFR